MISYGQRKKMPIMTKMGWRDLVGGCEILHDLIFYFQGIARTQSPTTRNYTPESPTFGVIAKVSQTGVQW